MEIAWGMGSLGERRAFGIYGSRCSCGRGKGGPIGVCVGPFVGEVWVLLLMAVGPMRESVVWSTTNLQYCFVLLL